MYGVQKIKVVTYNIKIEGKSSIKAIVNFPSNKNSHRLGFSRRLNDSEGGLHTHVTQKATVHFRIALGPTQPMLFYHWSERR